MSQHCAKISKINNLKKGGFVCVHGFRGFSPWMLGYINSSRTSKPLVCVIKEEYYVMTEREQKRRKSLGPRRTFKNNITS